MAAAHGGSPSLSTSRPHSGRAVLDPGAGARTRPGEPSCMPEDAAEYHEAGAPRGGERAVASVGPPRVSADATRGRLAAGAPLAHASTAVEGGGLSCSASAVFHEELPDSALVYGDSQDVTHLASTGGEVGLPSRQPQQLVSVPNQQQQQQRRQTFEHESDHDSCPFAAIRKSQWFMRLLHSIPRTSPIDLDKVLASFSIKNDFMFYPPPKTYCFLRDAETGAVTVGEAAEAPHPDEGEGRAREQQSPALLRARLTRRADYEAPPGLDSRKHVGARHGIGGLHPHLALSGRDTEFEMVFIPWRSEIQSYRIEKDRVILEKKVRVGGPLFAFSLGCPIPCSMIRPQGGMSSHIAIFFHCNGEDVGRSSCMRLQTLANALHVTVLVPEYPGYGLFRGSPSEAAVKAAMERVVQFLLCVDGTLTPSRLLLIGHSVGTAVAVHIAAYTQTIFERTQAHYENHLACPAAYTDELAQHGRPTFFEAFRCAKSGESPATARPDGCAEKRRDEAGGAAGRWQSALAGGPLSGTDLREEFDGFSPTTGAPHEASASARHEPIAVERTSSSSSSSGSSSRDGEGEGKAGAGVVGRRANEGGRRGSHPLTSACSSPGEAGSPAVLSSDSRARRGERPGGHSDDDDDDDGCGCGGRRLPGLGCLPCHVGGGQAGRRRYPKSNVTHCRHNAIGGLILISGFTALRCLEYVPTFKQTYQLHPTQLELRRRQVPCDTVCPAPVEWAAAAHEPVPPEQIPFDMESMTTPCVYKAARFLSFNRFPTVDVVCRLQETCQFFTHTPLLLVHGLEDELISPIHSVAIASKLRQCRRGGTDARVFLSLLTGGGHNDLPCIREIRRFYKDEVLLPHLERQRELRQRLADLYHCGRGQLGAGAAAAVGTAPPPRGVAEGERGARAGAVAHPESCRSALPPPRELYFIRTDCTLTREPSVRSGAEAGSGPTSPHVPRDRDGGAAALLFDPVTRECSAFTTAVGEEGNGHTLGDHEQDVSRTRQSSLSRDRDICGPFIHREISFLTEPGSPSAVVTNTSLLRTLEHTRPVSQGEGGAFAPAAAMLHMSMYPQLERYDAGSVLVASMRANALPKEEAWSLCVRHHRLAWMWRIAVALTYLCTFLVVLSFGIAHAVLCQPERLQGYTPAGRTASEYARDNRVLAWAVLESSMMLFACALRLARPYYGLSSVTKERDRHHRFAFQVYAVLSILVVVLLVGISIVMSFVLALAPPHRGGVNWSKWSTLPYSRRVWISLLPRGWMVIVASWHLAILLIIIVKNH